MKKITHFSMDHPVLAIAITLLITLLFLFQFPKARIDTDPENMLEADQPERVFYDQVKTDFGIRDMIVLGITDEGGIFRVETLKRIARITDEILKLDGVVVEDVISFSTTDNVTSEDGVLRVNRIMESPPETERDAEIIRAGIYDNPLFVEKIVSKDGRTAALYIPIERKDMSYRISGEIDSLVRKELGKGQTYHIAGLPVAEDTFGVEMFFQMGILAPLTGFVIFLLMFLLFRKGSLLISPMLTAMFSVVWGMGALIGAGFTVHIMSSMIPIFLMPIAVLDSVHILSEFHDRYPTNRDRKRTLLAVYDELYTPMLYTSLTSAVGFASLALADIPPVRVFGIFVAFGILVAWLLTMTFVPASIMLIREEKLIARVATGLRKTGRLNGVLARLGEFSFARRRTVITGAIFLLAAGVWGLTRIVVNDNPVKWFNENHKIRIADRVMNENFGGTYMAYLTVEGSENEVIKRPEVMAYIDSLQEYLEAMDVVGKTSSVADIVGRVGHVLDVDERPGGREVETRPQGERMVFRQDAFPIERRDHRRASTFRQAAHLGRGASRAATGDDHRMAGFREEAGRRRRRLRVQHDAPGTATGACVDRLRHLQHIERDRDVHRPRPPSREPGKGAIDRIDRVRRGLRSVAPCHQTVEGALLVLRLVEVTAGPADEFPGERRGDDQDRDGVGVGLRGGRCEIRQAGAGDDDADSRMTGRPSVAIGCETGALLMARADVTYRAARQVVVDWQCVDARDPEDQLHPVQLQRAHDRLGARERLCGVNHRGRHRRRSRSSAPDGAR